MYSPRQFYLWIYLELFQTFLGYSKNSPQPPPPPPSSVSSGHKGGALKMQLVPLQKQPQES